MEKVKNWGIMKIRNKKIYEYIAIALIFLVISIAILMQSPLNPMSKTISTSDSSVFIYGSNLIREGKILYKDFFDHKGPIFYLIEVIALSITKRKYNSEYG